MEHSGTNLEYIYEDGKRILPHIWEISAGVDRTLFAIIDSCLKQGKEGLYLSLNPKIAPYNCAIFPLINKGEISEFSKKIEDNLKKQWLDVFYDGSGSIGRRYARMDEIGVPFCITVDGDSLKQKDVTIRNRDNQKQIRVKISELPEIIRGLINGEIIFEKAGKLIG